MKNKAVLETIIHSGKLRAKQTAEILKIGLNPGCDFIEKDYLGPNDSTDGLFREVENRREDLWVAGHLPFLSRMLSRLIFNDENKTLVNFTPASVAVLEKSPEYGWCLSGFLRPDML